MKPQDRLVWLTGLGGLAMIIIGGATYARQKQLLGRPGGLGRARLRGTQAPVVGSYNDGNMKTTLRSSPDMPIEERLATIQDLVLKSAQDPQMRKLALMITARCPERDKICEAEAIYHAVKHRVRYTGDIGAIRHADGVVDGIDLYQSARRTIEMGGGDCDDQAIVNATLLALNGFDPILRVVKQKSDPDWSHIYAGFYDGRKFVALDTTLPGNNNFGIEGPFAKFKDFPA